jgi:uncharacterized membrane protein YdjX (TVP38/TMEM64 family)
MRRLLPALLILAIAGLFLGGLVVRKELGIGLSVESVRDFVVGLGWKAAVAYVGMVTFRFFLMLPSSVVLPVGGLLFGLKLGTLLGAIGITASAVLKYTIARALGREWLRPWFGSAVDAFERHGAAAGPAVVALATAHPTGPMTPVYWGAGFASVPVLPFLGAVVLTAPLRAFLFAFFGSTLLDPGTPRFWIATALLASAAVAPLAHPAVRERLRRATGRGEPTV